MDTRPYLWTSAVRLALLVVAVASAVLLGSCGGTTTPFSSTATTRDLPSGSDPVAIEPRRFSAKVDNPLFPLAVGSTWVYRETNDEGEALRDVVTVEEGTRTVAGVATRVVHDRATRDGVVVEDTYDWYAQDSSGNVWYFGEDTTEYEPGKPPSTEGSWEAGIDGALPGVIMPASPTVGLAYREEYLRGEAEDRAVILATDELVAVPAGTFRDVVMTRNSTPVEPDVLEYKWYAPGVGTVLEITTSGGTDRVHLVSFRKG